MKTCPKCGGVKPLHEFHKGASRCRPCCKEAYAQYRLDNLERLREYDRVRERNKDRIAARDARTREYLSAHPDRRSAMEKLNYAVRRGVVKRWPVCAVPECECTRVVGHHADYSRPLDVVWLCEGHHKRLHIMAKELEEEREKMAA